LGEAVHATGNLGVDMVVGDERPEVVEVHDLVRDLVDMDADVFRAVHGSHQVEIFDVHAHEFGTGCREYTIDEQLHVFDGGGFGANVTRVVNAVPSDNMADTAWLFLLGPIGADDSDIGGLAVAGQVDAGDETDGVSAFDVLVPLGKAAPFLTGGDGPFGAIRTSEELRVLGELAGVRVEGFEGEGRGQWSVRGEFTGGLGKKGSGSS